MATFGVCKFDLPHQLWVPFQGTALALEGAMTSSNPKEIDMAFVFESSFRHAQLAVPAFEECTCLILFVYRTFVHSSGEIMVQLLDTLLRHLRAMEVLSMKGWRGLSVTRHANERKSLPIVVHSCKDASVLVTSNLYHMILVFVQSRHRCRSQYCLQT